MKVGQVFFYCKLENGAPRIDCTRLAFRNLFILKQLIQLRPHNWKQIGMYLHQIRLIKITYLLLNGKGRGCDTLQRVPSDQIRSVKDAWCCGRGFITSSCKYQPAISTWQPAEIPSSIMGPSGFALRIDVLKMWELKHFKPLAQIW